MRRIASIFKRSDKSDVASSSNGSHNGSQASHTSQSISRSPRFFRSLSNKALPRDSSGVSSVVPPVPSIPQASSSSSSSSDSPAPSTPIEDLVAPRSSSKKPSILFLRKNNPASLTHVDSWDGPSPFQTHNPYVSSGTPVDDSDDDQSSATSSSHAESYSSSSISRSNTPQAFAHSLTTNALIPPFSAPPLLNLPGVPLFPRSCNTVSSLPHKESTESTLHRTRLIHRLEEHRKLTPSESQSITAFASRRAIPKKRTPSLRLDDDAVKDSKRITMISPGLRSWVARPCFEDRMLVFTLAPPESPHAFNVSRVSGSVYGVAALELSPGLEALAGLVIEDTPEEPCLPSAASSSSSLSTSPASTPVRNQPYKLIPSPLRLETTTTSSSPVSSANPMPTPNKARVRNSVRFEVTDKEDKEDMIPLGQIMRIKQGRAEKANFLRLERERRTLEVERIQHEMERKKWEKEKQRWDDEKRAIEEEKRKHQYAQEVVAARKRRESHMFKQGLSTPILDDSEHFPTTYSRPQYDSQRRQASEPTMTTHRSRDKSPGSSRGTSRTRVDSLPRSTRSRPPSLYSSHTVSSEDVQLRDGRGRSNKRNSIFSESPRHSFLLPQQMVPVPPPMVPQQMVPQQMVPQQMVPQQMVPFGWSPVPPMSPMPYYTFNVDNMPLLPPTAPFMMQQRGSGRRSQNSSSSGRPSSSHSADGLPRPAPLKPRAPHQRHSSGDIESSKRLSAARGVSSSPTTPGHNNHAPHSRSPPFQAPVHASYGYSSHRRQTVIT